MNEQDMMRDIVEKAGYKYLPFNGKLQYYHGMAWQCEGEEPFRYLNPTDLNELFRLAEKLGIYAGNWKIDEDGIYHVLIHHDILKRPDIYSGATLADALCNALWQAIQEVK